jgi:fused signal recognition particle receptor
MYGSAIGVDAVILTKSDADDRGGTVLSVAYVAEKPILFLGTGQSYGDFEEFKISAIVDKLFGVASE